MSFCFFESFFSRHSYHVRRRDDPQLFFWETLRPGKAPAFDSSGRSHCHLQCFDTQLDLISVCGLSEYLGSSSMLFVIG